MSEQPTIHWTQFPAAAVTDASGNPVNWLDHKAAHQAVSRLFPACLPGDAETRRALAGILYRLDVVQNTATVLVQSLVPPELVPAGQRTMELPSQTWNLAADTRVAFRVSVNPVRRITRYYEEADKKSLALGSNQSGRTTGRPSAHRKQTAHVVPLPEMPQWLDEKLGPALTGIEIVDHRRDKSRSGPHRVIVDRIDGIATVGDAEALLALRTVGVGRSKAYGCGLLTTIRLAS